METRDKLFTEEQYLKQLAEYADDIMQKTYCGIKVSPFVQIK